MPTFDDAFDGVCTALTHRFGRAARELEEIDPFEAMVAVALDHTLGEGHSRAALEGLSDGGLLSAERLADGDLLEIVDALREHGVAATARSVAPLKQLARWVLNWRDRGIAVTDLAGQGEGAPSVGQVRDGLTELKGVGKAAADAIVLFALNRPSYPVDRATFRVLVRHGWIDSTAEYEDARDLIVSQAQRAEFAGRGQSLDILRDLSHGMERLGRPYCRARAAHCDGCPLEHFLPDGGPREADG